MNIFALLLPLVMSEMSLGDQTLSAAFSKLNVALKSLTKIAKPGATTTLECITDVNFIMIWSYLKNINVPETTLTEDTAVNPAYQSRLQLTGNRSLGEYCLKIINVSCQDEGKYRCYQQRKNISVIEINFEIEAAPKELIILNQPTYGIISQTEGQMLNITCQAIGGNTKGNISWINVSDISSKFTELIEWPFVYLNFTTDYKQHRKQLTCGVAHALLSGQMKISVTLNVQYIPKISINRHPVNEFTEGQRIKLECLDTSNPSKTNITWEKSGIILSSKPIYEKNNIDTTDSGIYICIVFNSLGHERENISILVNKRKDTYNSDSSTGIGPLEVIVIYVCVCSCGTLLFCLAAFILPKCRRVTIRRAKYLIGSYITDNVPFVV